MTTPKRAFEFPIVITTLQHFAIDIENPWGQVNKVFDLTAYRQRPSDVMKMTEGDVRDAVMRVQQGKTGTKVRIGVSIDLADVLDRIRKRKAAHKVHSTKLVVNEYGKPVGLHAINRRWVDACVTAGLSGLEFRDLRAKAGTDKADSSGDIRQAQAQLGHSSVVMTEHYVRNRRGAKVTPTR